MSSSSKGATTTVKHLTAKELAARWGISVFDVYKLAREGTIPTFRISERRLRFRLEDIERWEQERVQGQQQRSNAQP